MNKKTILVGNYGQMSNFVGLLKKQGKLYKNMKEPKVKYTIATVDNFKTFHRILRHIPKRVPFNKSGFLRSAGPS